MKFLLVAYLSASTILADHKYEYVRIVNLQQKPIIQGTLNGKTAYFLLDTGSDFTLLHEGMSKKYGFSLLDHRQDEPNLKALGVGGQVVQFKSVCNAIIALGNTELSGDYHTYDMSRLVTVIQKKCGIEIAGIIGSDTMKRHGVIIDYKSREIGVISARRADRLPLKPVSTSKALFIKK